MLCHCRLWVYFDCQIVSSFYTKIFVVNQGSRSVHLGGHYSLFDSGHQNPMVTKNCGKCLLLFDKLTLLIHDILRFSFCDSFATHGGKRPSVSITTLFKTWPGSVPLFFAYLRAFFSLFYRNISSWFSHLPQSPISPKLNPYALLSRLVPHSRRLLPYRWPKLRKPNKKVSRNIFVKVNIFSIRR